MLEIPIFELQWKKKAECAQNLTKSEKSYLLGEGINIFYSILNEKSNGP